MKILVIGGLGFIGRAFSEYAVQNNNDVIIYDTVEYRSEPTDRFKYYRLKNNEEDDTVPADADAMVLLAAKRPYSGFSFEDYNYNISIAEKWFQIAKNNGISNVVFASSKAVFSDQNCIPWGEELYTSPLSLYGASKVAVEQIASFLNDHDKMHIKSLRFAQVVGLGERKGFLINTLVDNAVNHRKQIIYGDGSQRRQYVYIKDVCGAILTALNHQEEKGVFNIGMEGTVSNLELAECINSVFGNEGNLVCDQSKSMDDFCDEMLVKKMKERMGWRAEYNLREMFEDIMRCSSK